MQFEKKKTKTTKSFFISDDIASIIKRISKETGLSKSQIVDNALRESLLNKTDGMPVLKQ